MREIELINSETRERLTNDLTLCVQRARESLRISTPSNRRESQSLLNDVLSLADEWDAICDKAGKIEAEVSRRNISFEDYDRACQRWKRINAKLVRLNQRIHKFFDRLSEHTEQLLDQTERVRQQNSKMRQNLQELNERKENSSDD